MNSNAFYPLLSLSSSRCEIWASTPLLCSRVGSTRRFLRSAMLNSNPPICFSEMKMELRSCRGITAARKSIANYVKSLMYVPKGYFCYNLIFGGFSCQKPSFWFINDAPKKLLFLHIPKSISGQNIVSWYSVVLRAMCISNQRIRREKHACLFFFFRS